MASREWIGVDLDKTLAHYESDQYPEIGPPVEKMMSRVKQWLRAGIEVRIVTARAAKGPEDIGRIQKWLEEHGIGDVKITDKKDEDMRELWDDKAVAVVPNTGEPVNKEDDNRDYSDLTEDEEGDIFGLFRQLNKEQ